MHALDERFRQRKHDLARHRRRRRLLRVSLSLAALALVGAVLATFYLLQNRWIDSDYDEELVFADDAEDIGEGAPVWVPAIVDLAGDPMWISLSRDEDGQTRLQAIERPQELEDAGVPAEIHLLADAMVSAGERFMTTIPATQEDFAFFQAQRAAASVPVSLEPQLPEPEAAERTELDVQAFAGEAAGWGAPIGESEELPDFVPTEIENNTSVALVMPQSARRETTEDFFVRVLVPRRLGSVIIESGLTSDDAERADEALESIFGVEALEPGHVVALRGRHARGGVGPTRLMQVSVYASDVYVGSFARNATGAFVAAVDPWVREDLFNYSGEQQQAVPGRQYRLLDAIYSTAARNSVPTSVIGEAIMHLSRGHDLNAFATPEDRLLLLYGEEPRGEEGAGGRVLYVAVRGPERSMECFVFRQAEGEFSCVSGDDVVHALTVANGMVTPVNGVLTSAFGPRRHPILRTVRLHQGVDWRAPVGAPIFAAFDGEIVFQGDAGGYGNLVRIRHAGGRETRYAHMQRFETGRGVGAAVRAGDVIGYVGTTGLSTGPHLHFELHVGGEPIDPLATVVAAVAAATSDASAVETLVDRIIRVESAGNPRARNPLSTATGLGQFIESTWIRMMNTYRQDLARSLSRAELLALRFDPTISREMVRNLAREGEAYLRARGHQITAGRLYLCHFLGMDGAHQVLSSAGNRPLIDVLGAGVIRANPFLTGKDVNYVLNWAEGKMRGRGREAPAPQAVETVQVRQTSPEFERYKNAVTQLLERAATAASL